MVQKRVAVTVVAALVIFAILYGWQSWNTVKQQQVLELETTLELTGKAVDRYLLEVQAGLTALEINVRAASGLADLARAQPWLKAYADRHPELTSVDMIAPNGQLLASSATSALTGLPSIKPRRPAGDLLSDAKPGSLSIRRARPGALHDQWQIPIVHIPNLASGQHDFYLVATAPVAMLEAFWSKAPIVARAYIVLMRDVDGYLVSRFPAAANASPEETYASPRIGPVRNFLLNNGFPKSGFVEGPNTLRGIEVGAVFARLENFPLTLIVAMPKTEFRAVWWERVRVPYILTLLLAAILAFLYRYAVARHRDWNEQQLDLALELQRRVDARTDEIRRLGARLEEAESRERRQIARDLHDDLSQTLAAVRIRLSPLESDPREDVRSTATTIAGLVDRADQDTRNLASRLAPPALYEIGLVPALQALADEIERDFGIEVAIDDDGQPKPLSQSARSILYRAVRELLINVAKHAAAREAMVECRRAGDEIVLQVSDAGTGYDPEAPQLQPGTRLGLRGTGERISFIGGSLEITTAPGKGTQARIRAPLSTMDQSERERTT